MSGEDQIANGRACGEDAAAYALGALEPSELEAFRRHLRDCAACQKEVAEFEQITGALPDASVRYQAPKDLRRRVMQEVRATPKAAPASRQAPRSLLASGHCVGRGARRGGDHRGGGRGRA